LELPDADQQRYIDKFKSLGIDNKCRLYEIRRTEWMDDSDSPHDGIDITTETY